jgi:uncharacterized protein
MKLTLSLTHNCNLNCPYCYAGRKYKKDMSLETAKKIVDFGMAMATAGEPLEFGFFGGEPFLRFALIKEIVAYVRQHEQSAISPVDFHVTTNGTLITPDILSFLKDENIGLCISIDGPPHIHDRNRRYRNGRGSSHTVIKNLGLAAATLDKVQVNAVYGPESIESLVDSVNFFIDLEIPLIHLNPNITTAWDDYSMDFLAGSYQAVADAYIDSYQRGKEIAVNLIDSKIIVFLKQGYEMSDRCGMGTTEWGFAPSGNIYPCERLIGDDKGEALCLGNIHTGINTANRCAALKRRGNHNPECATCTIGKYCMNWCGCTNYLMTGDTGLGSTFLCRSEKASIRAAQYTLDALQNNDLFGDHFYRYLNRTQSPIPGIILKEESHGRQNYLSS